MKLNICVFAIAGILFSSCESNYSGSPSSGSGKGGSMARFTIVDNYLYTVTNPGGRWESELTIFDISNEEKPTELQKKTIPNYVETIFPTDTLLFFGTRTGMLIYSTKNPGNPSYISEYAHIYSCDPVVVQKNLAYVTLNSESSWCGRTNNRLDIIDISDVYNPKTAAEYPMTAPRGLGIDGYTLFVCDDGLKAYNIGEGANIELVDKFNIDGYDVIPQNGYLLMIGEEGFYQYKYDIDNVKLVSSITTD